MRFSSYCSVAWTRPRRLRRSRARPPGRAVDRAEVACDRLAVALRLVLLQTSRDARCPSFKPRLTRCMVDVPGHVVAVGGCSNWPHPPDQPPGLRGERPLWWMLVDVFLFIRTRKKERAAHSPRLELLGIRTGLGTHPPTATNPPRSASRTARRRFARAAGRYPVNADPSNVGDHGDHPWPGPTSSRSPRASPTTSSRRRDAHLRRPPVL